MTECFKIQLLWFDNETDLFDIRKGISFYSVPCLRPLLSVEPNVIEADPFLFVKNERLFLFYESKPWLSPGVIKMVSTKDMVHWTTPRVVLREPFHLSFPWIFEDNDHVYMIPESCGDNSIRLYQAEANDLESFHLIKKLMVDINPENWQDSYCDTTIYKKDDLYYLFTTRRSKGGINTLELYTSYELEGGYSEHPCSPLVENNKTGRNAGCILLLNGDLFRFSQDCVNHYGDNVNVCKITKLTPTEYEEEEVLDNIIPIEEEFYKNGGHQFNAVKFRGKWIVATDAKEYHQMYGHRIIYKFMRMFGIRKKV